MAQLDLRSGAIDQTCGKVKTLLTVLASLKEEVSQESRARPSKQLWIHQGAISEHLTHVPLHAGGTLLLLRFPLVRFHDTLYLFNNHYFETSFDNPPRILVLCHLRKPNMWLLLLAHPLQVADSLRDEGIVIKNLVKLPDLEQSHFVKMLCLELPVLHQHRGIVSLRLLILCLVLHGIRYPKRALVVAGL